MKGILKYRNKSKVINFKNIPTLYAIMDNLEDKPAFKEKKELLISKKVNIILSKDEVFHPDYVGVDIYFKKAVWIDNGLDKGFLGYPLSRFNGYDINGIKELRKKWSQ